MKINFFKIIIICFTVFSCQEKAKTTIKKTKPNKSTTISQSKGKKISEKDTTTIAYLYKYNPYDYDTKLRNGYKLEFSYFQKHKDSVIEMCLTLKRKEKIIDTLNIMGYGAPHKNLGYIGADFDKYFAFVNSFGSGNPHYLTLLRKKDAKEIKSGYIINSNSHPELLVYEDKIDRKMKIFDFEKMKDIDISNINYDCFLWQLSETLKIQKVTKEEVFVEYTNNENKVIKYKYYR